MFVITKIKTAEYVRTYYEVFESNRAYTKVSRAASQYILLSGSLWDPVRSSMLKNKRIFSLVISNLMPAFSTVQLDVAKNHINYYVAKNNSRSLRSYNLTKLQNYTLFESLINSLEVPKSDKNNNSKIDK